jgi:hypothetical protein
VLLFALPYTRAALRRETTSPVSLFGTTTPEDRFVDTTPHLFYNILAIFRLLTLLLLFGLIFGVATASVFCVRFHRTCLAAQTCTPSVEGAASHSASPMLTLTATAVIVLSSSLAFWGR